jgi:hypothetical protein
MLTSLIPAFIALIFLFIPVGVVFAVRRRDQQRKRSPLSRQLLRSPGESLRKELDDLMWDVAGYLMVLPLIPLVLYSTHLTQISIGGQPLKFSIILVVIGLLFISFFSYKTYATMRKVWRLRLGYDAELAMGQELDQLMRQGAAVFHDIPAEGFNIDHVFLAPNGVFAIETKGRSKPNRDRGVEDAKVTFDGKALAFPGWVETKPLDQARLQAKWLSKWLSSAVGESVAVKAVVTLPGWYVERKGQGDVLVISGREATALFKVRQELLPDNLAKRIEHQLEQRCRDVEPTLYGKKSKIGS